MFHPRTRLSGDGFPSWASISWHHQPQLSCGSTDSCSSVCHWPCCWSAKVKMTIPPLRPPFMKNQLHRRKNGSCSGAGLRCKSIWGTCASKSTLNRLLKGRCGRRSQMRTFWVASVRWDQSSNGYFTDPHSITFWTKPGPALQLRNDGYFVSHNTVVLILCPIHLHFPKTYQPVAWHQPVSMNCFPLCFFLQFHANSNPSQQKLTYG